MQEQPPTQSQIAIRTTTALSKKRAASNIQKTQLQHQQTEHSNHPPSSQPMPSGVMGFSAGGTKNNYNYWNSVEINQFYMN